MSNTALGLTTFLLLVLGFAPAGLFQIARSCGIDTSGGKILGDQALFVIFGTFIVACFLALTFAKNEKWLRVTILVILGLAILNLAGCASMWSDLRHVH